MEALSALIELLRQPLTVRVAAIAGACWLGLNLVCWVLGAIGLSALGRKKQLSPRLPAVLPGGQIWATLKLAGADPAAKQAEHLLWWCPTLAVAGCGAALWAVVLYLDEGHALLLLLLVLAALLLIVALVFYILIREMELRAVLALLQNKGLWSLAVIGTVLGVPIQRILIFAKMKKLLG